MNPLSVVAIMLSTSALFAGFYVLGLNRKELSNRLFCLICLSIAGWLFCAAMCYSAPAEADVIFWFHAAALFYLPFASLNLHFYHDLTLPGKVKPVDLPLFYLPVPLLVAVNYSPIGPYQHFARMGHLWKALPDGQGWGYFIIVAYISLVAGLCMILILKSAFTADEKRQKLHARVLGASIGVTILLTVLTAFILPHLRFYPMPSVGVIWLGFYILAIYLNVFRYRFLNRKMMLPAEELLLQMEDFGLLLKPDGTIHSMNSSLSRRLELGDRDWRDRNIQDLLDERDFNGWLTSPEVLKTTMIRRGSLTFSTPKGPLATEANLTGIFDRHGELEAFLLLARENAKKQEFIRRYKITAREMQVLEGCIKGESNSEIAIELGMSVRTVETHLVHLYNKLGINSKIEMIHFAVNYQLCASKSI